MIKKSFFKKVIFITIIVLIVLVAKVQKTYAASVNISCDSKGTVDQAMTISVSGTAAQWKLNLLVDGKTIATSNELDSISNKKISFSGKYTPTAVGTKTVSLEGSITDEDGTTIREFTTKTITVEKKNTENNDTNTTNTTTVDPATPTISSDATLSNLGINPNDFTGFRKAITSYDVSVPKSVEKVTIYANATDKKATVTGTGEKALNIGKNTFNIKVTAEDKTTTKTYTLNITRKETSSDANLSNLGIRPKEYDFTGFKMSNTQYNVSVPNKVENVTIYAYTSDSNATLTGTGSKNLKVGDNKFEIKVTAEDKTTTKTYYLTVTRKEEGEEPEEPEDKEPTASTTGITDIKIEDYELTPKFSPDKFEYKVDIPSSTEKVDVKVKAGEGIETEIVGNEDLKLGENTITILVRDTKTDATTIYQITANVKNLESSNTEENVIKQENEIDLTETNKAFNAAQENIKIRRGLIIAIIILVILVIIVLIILRRKAKEDDEYFDDEDISETSNFYKQMEEKYISDNQDSEEEDRRGRYTGKRFK